MTPPQATTITAPHPKQEALKLMLTLIQSNKIHTQAVWNDEIIVHNH